MLSILGLFLLFLGNVNAQGKEPLPKRCEKIYERFIKNHTRGYHPPIWLTIWMQWHLLSNGTQNDDLTVVCLYFFRLFQ
ncbi:hypothetical protein OSTOST_02312 [Ostertagia ostertagi]